MSDGTRYVGKECNGSTVGEAVKALLYTSRHRGTTKSYRELCMQLVQILKGHKTEERMRELLLTGYRQDIQDLDRIAVALGHWQAFKNARLETNEGVDE